MHFVLIVEVYSLINNGDWRKITEIHRYKIMKNYYKCVEIQFTKFRFTNVCLCYIIGGFLWGAYTFLHWQMWMRHICFSEQCLIYCYHCNTICCANSIDYIAVQYMNTWPYNIIQHPTFNILWGPWNCALPLILVNNQCSEYNNCTGTWLFAQNEYRHEVIITQHIHQQIQQMCNTWNLRPANIIVIPVWSLSPY